MSYQLPEVSDQLSVWSDTLSEQVYSRVSFRGGPLKLLLRVSNNTINMSYQLPEVSDQLSVWSDTLSEQVYSRVSFRGGPPWNFSQVFPYPIHGMVSYTTCCHNIIIIPLTTRYLT